MPLYQRSIKPNTRDDFFLKPLTENLIFPAHQMPNHGFECQRIW
jgi:hypothetical protein